MDACLDCDGAPDSNLQACLTHCIDCGICFLTHPRCAGRQDLRCPFGCRREHRRKLANERSRRHYQTESGRRNKKRLNAGRSGKAAGAGAGGANSPPEPNSGPQSTSAPQPASAERPLPAELDEEVELQLETVTLGSSSLANSPMLPYVQMLIRLIDGAWIELNELVGLLHQAMRQRSIAFRRRTDYVLEFLHQHPP